MFDLDSASVKPSLHLDISCRSTHPQPYLWQNAAPPHPKAPFVRLGAETCQGLFFFFSQEHLKWLQTFSCFPNLTFRATRNSCDSHMLLSVRIYCSAVWWKCSLLCVMKCWNKVFKVLNILFLAVKVLLKLRNIDEKIYNKCNQQFKFDVWEKKLHFSDVVWVWTEVNQQSRFNSSQWLFELSSVSPAGWCRAELIGRNAYKCDTFLLWPRL